jgi:hypothetical protein
MPSFGAYLRELRQAKGFSIEEVSRATRVSARYLEALEAEALSALPAPVFTKGFIRAYCQSLGEPSDEALSRYRERVGESSTPPPPGPPARLLESRARGPVLVSLVLLIAFGLGLFVLTLSLQSRVQKIEVSTPPPASPASTAIAHPGVVSRESAMPAQGGPARLVARAIEPTWISVQTDDGQVVQELLPAGATREWISPKRFVLSIGNAGGITLELNGQPVPPLGASGAVVHKLVLPGEPEAPKP